MLKFGFAAAIGFFLLTVTSFSTTAVLPGIGAKAPEITLSQRKSKRS